MSDFQPQFPNYKIKVEQSFASQNFMGHIDAKLVDVQPGFCEIHVPFNENLTQQNVVSSMLALSAQ